MALSSLNPSHLGCSNRHRCAQAGGIGFSGVATSSFRAFAAVCKFRLALMTQCCTSTIRQLVNMPLHNIEHHCQSLVESKINENEEKAHGYFNCSLLANQKVNIECL